MNAYFIKCISKEGLCGISTNLYYFKDQALNIVDELNAKNDGYTYSVFERNI
jgi:hypothetical protein